MRPRTVGEYSEGLSAALDQSWLAASQRVFSRAAWESSEVAGSVQCMNCLEANELMGNRKKKYGGKRMMWRVPRCGRRLSEPLGPESPVPRRSKAASALRSAAALHVMRTFTEMTRFLPVSGL